MALGYSLSRLMCNKFATTPNSMPAENTGTDRIELNWTIVQLTAGELGLFLANWDELNLRLMGGHAMLDGRFIEALMRHFGTPGVQLATAESAERIEAMLLIRPHASGLRIWSTFLPAQAQIGPALLPPDMDLSPLLRALPGHAGELDLLCNDPKFGDMRQLPGHRLESLPHALTMSITLTGSFDDYWALRPRKLIQNMRRYARRLQSEPEPVRVLIHERSEDVGAAVMRYAELEAKGWKGREGTAITPDSAQGRFYLEVMNRFSSTAEALVYELWLGDDLLASRMLLKRQGMAVMLKTAFDEAFERFAPGRMLLMRTLEDLFERMPGGSVEFYTDAEPDLLAWSSSQRWINHVSLYRHTGLQTLYGLMRSGRRWLQGEHSPSTNAVMAERSRASVEVFGHPRELPAEAKALMAERERDYVEFGADWFALIADTVYARAATLRLYVLSRQGRTLAVLPTVRAAGSAETLALGNYYTTLFSPSFTDDLAEDDLLLLTLELRRQGGTGIYRFAPMDPAAPAFGLLRGALQRAGLRTYRYFAFGNWYLPVASDWADYLKGRSGQLRSTIKRMSKRLAAANGHLEILQSPADVERGLAAYQAVYAASWKVPEPYADFIPALVGLCARRGWLRLGLAWIEERPIAAQLWIVHEGRAHIYKVAYDEVFKSIAPGTLVSALLMEHVIDQDQVREVDYLIGDDAYKKTLMSHRRERFGLVAYDPRTPTGLQGLARQALGEAWRRTQSWVQTRLQPRQAADTITPPE